MPASERDAARQRFLHEAGCADAQLEPLVPDASFRRYFRVRSGEPNRMLMDAPPPQENLRPFLQVAHHLSALGLRVPAVYSFDLGAGFALLEDFGDTTFSRLLQEGAEETGLYRQAVDFLIALQTHPAATSIDVPAYDDDLLVDEVLRMIDWYYPGVCGKPASGSLREEFASLWRAVLGDLPPLTPTLVLRDFHVDNLMQVVSADGDTQCGLLDFQDAVIGSPAYDLMSLLEDARREVSSHVHEAMRAHYHRSIPVTGIAAFDLHFHSLGAQRHCKVLGNFARLFRRDGKRIYVTHIPRVVALLQRHLDVPLLQPLRDWLDKHLPMRHTAQIVAQ